MTGRVLGWALAALVLLGAAPVLAADDARAAYDAGLEAAAAGRWLEAAELFARADELEPSPVALTSALSAVLEADAPALGLTLADRAVARSAPPAPVDADSDYPPLATEARARFGDRAGKLEVACTVACTVEVDGATLAAGAPRWLDLGEHRLRVHIGGALREERVTLTAGATLTRRFEPPPAPKPKQGPRPRPAPTPPAPESSGISPVWFYVGLGVSGALAIGTVASAVDTRDLHDEFEATGAGRDDGEASQLRTNALFFTTLGVGLCTAALGAFVVGWGDDDAAVAWRLGPAGLGGSFE